MIPALRCCLGSASCQHKTGENQNTQYEGNSFHRFSLLLLLEMAVSEDGVQDVAPVSFGASSIDQLSNYGKRFGSI
jgi:hypothetical protein